MTKLNGALCFLHDYIEAYLRTITLDKLADKAADKWQDVLTGMVEAHIAEIKQKV